MRFCSCHWTPTRWRIEMQCTRSLASWSRVMLYVYTKVKHCLIIWSCCSKFLDDVSSFYYRKQTRIGWTDKLVKINEERQHFTYFSLRLQRKKIAIWNIWSLLFLALCDCSSIGFGKFLLFLQHFQILDFPLLPFYVHKNTFFHSLGGKKKADKIKLWEIWILKCWPLILQVNFNIFNSALFTAHTYHQC